MPLFTIMCKKEATVWTMPFCFRLEIHNLLNRIAEIVSFTNHFIVLLLHVLTFVPRITTCINKRRQWNQDVQSRIPPNTDTSNSNQNARAKMRIWQQRPENVQSNVPKQSDTSREAEETKLQPQPQWDIYMNIKRMRMSRMLIHVGNGFKTFSTLLAFMDDHTYWLGAN